jgi:2-methylisocitrate lyase-like PEP mutase family enzyme
MDYRNPRPAPKETSAVTALPRTPRPTWKQLLAREQPLLLPFAHDALSARLIERAGFAAYGIGGFALVGARHALPDVGLAGFGEISAGVRDIVAASALPVLVDCDDGYGDGKNVARTVQGYEAMGVAAIFMEDQTAPKRCGHMTGKSVIEPAAMAAKIRAAAAARRNPDTFIIARTDARAVHGLDDALRRAELYLRAGADGLFIEAPQSVDELARVGRAFAGVPQLANMVEGGGHTPILPPAELARLGFAMVAYPTTLLFGVTRTIEQALADLKTGRPANSNAGVDFDTFKDIVGLADWAAVEERAGDTGMSASAPPAAKARAART